MSCTPRIVLTRQEQRNKAWQQSLVEAGLQVLNLPLVRFSSLEVPEEFITAAYDWILFTSPQGVDSFVAAGLETKGAKLGALGKGTSAALKEAGLPDDLGFYGSDGTDLAKAFVEQITAPARVLLPGAAKRMGEPRTSLSAAGFEVQVLPLYKTLPIGANELSADILADDIVFFCSPSAVRAFIAAFAERPDCIAIGETTAAVCRKNGFSTKVAESPDLNAMVRAAGCGPLTTIPEKES